MEILFAVCLFIVGLCLGSFAGAQVWRLRFRQLEEDKLSKIDYDKSEYKKLSILRRKSVSQDRSRCLNCSHSLAWFDLIPVASWLSTGGKCRYCHKSIGYFEPLIELSVAVFFVVSFVFWPTSLSAPLDIFQFVLWLVAGVMLAILFAYDSKWFLLPNVIMFPLIALAAVFSSIELLQTDSVWLTVFDTVGAVAVLSGLYLVLWLVSRGAWIGFGDVKLGLALGLMLGNWQLAFLTLFLANLIGCFIVIPGLMTKKLSRTTQVPFGPMLIAGFVISALAGQQIISWYFSISTTLFL